MPRYRKNVCVYIYVMKVLTESTKNHSVIHACIFRSQILHYATGKVLVEVGVMTSSSFVAAVIIIEWPSIWAHNQSLHLTSQLIK